MKKGVLRSFSIIFIFVLTIGIWTPLTVQAEEKKTVRVGYFKGGDYYTLDAKGELQGYDVDYLKEISAYTNLDFKFVDCTTWMNTVAMLESGEVDLVGTTQWDEAREEKYEFCKKDYGSSIGEIVTLPENEVSYEDYAAIQEMKIGCLFNYVHRDDLDAKLQENRLTPQIVTFHTQTELANALIDGTVDAVASNSHILDQDWPVIEKFSYSSYFFVAQKGNTELTDAIDDALIRIHLDNPEYDDNLVQKWFPTLNNNCLTKEEKDYVNSLDSLTFCFCTNEGYLCRTEDGEYVGINPAIAKSVCEKLGVKYKEVQFDYPELVKSLSQITDGTQSGNELVERVKSMGIDVWGDFYFDQSWADTIGVGITEPYMNATYYEIRKRGVKMNKNTCKVAAVRGLRYTSEIVNSYNSDQIVWCDDFESCVKAIKSGKADITIINTLAAEYYLSMFQYNNLSATLIDFNNQSCMATIDDQDGLLASALNKTIRSMSAEETNSLVRTETAKTPKQNMLVAYFYTHMATAIIALVVLAAGVVLLLSMIYIVQKSRKQNELLQRATNAKSDFLTKMSHDIRTPMNAIINLTSMVEKEIDDKDAALQDIQKIKNSNEFLLSLINDVLDISRIEEGKMVLKRQLYRDAEFIDYMHTTFDQLCCKKNITFQIEPGEYETAVMTDRVRFNQICFNLVSNAVKYTPEGGHVTLQMKYHPITQGKLPLDIYVIDDGVGMSKEFVARAFQAFEQENRQFMSVEGTGLGLSIVKEIVDLMKGTIEIDSEENKGTIIHVHLDLDQADQALIDSDQKEEKTHNSDLQCLEGKNILVVEDHGLNMQIITRILEQKGMQVIKAVNGAEAIEHFEKHQETLDAVLMDIRMPIMNGLEATSAIRALDTEKAREIPIIAMTANAYEEDVQKSLNAGMNEHMAKPVNPDLLYDMLAKLMGKNGSVNEK